ncbi:cofactor-independent phosphoglycerate mutase [Novipirellula aureliae]|uniref:Cofactor-independent phosphoglycerate mutase n=1 Tax=Novipirellula aureliae TaxID=2527966 RepID=A0A5C6DRB1_9BACT|nr:cofactor-independent phosphoglycerate mutase [Novipirellula aureliae]TWU37546.1 cofactor-independent phosphoglycerate mutase [Novipirellula aureliae]
MKYVIVIPDGCADEPIEALGGRTPLEVANVPAMDELAKNGKLGLANNTPDHLPAGSEVANLCLLGYDPDRYFTGRAPLEAAAQGITLEPGDWAVRCNLVTIEEQTMVDFTADHVTTEEATELLESLQAELRSEDPIESRLNFVPGVSYRNLLIFRGSESIAAPFSKDTRSTAPHDLTDLPVSNDFPRGPGSDWLVRLMNRSADVFADHPVNKRRVAAGKRPVTSVWLWGLGDAPKLPSFESLHGVRGVMITAVDLLRGIAALVGWPRIDVEGATGYLDTDYAAKGRAAIKALQTYDLVCVHVEAPDEASHEGRHDAKIEAIEQIDKQIVDPLIKALSAKGDYRILITPDHPTYCRTKKHTHAMVPWLISGTGIDPDSETSYDEKAAENSGLNFANGWDLIGHFIESEH